MLYSDELISTDHGRTWRYTRQADTVYAFNAVATKDHLIYGTRLVVLRPDLQQYEVTYDKGRTWQSLDESFPFALALAYAHEVDERDSTFYVVGTDGIFAYGRTGTIGTAVEDEQPGAAQAVRLHSYPNPFRDAVTVAVSLPEAGHLRLEVFDGLGRRVALLVDEARAAGTHRVTFDAANLPSGVYLYRAVARGQTLSGTLTHAR